MRARHVRGVTYDSVTCDSVTSDTVTYDAELYELTHRGNPGDVGFYLGACRGATSVLELGAGYGRVTLALAMAGHSVVGVELDAGLLARAQAHLCAASQTAAGEASAGSVRFVLGDMTSVDLGQRFDRVLIPHSGLYCLLTPQRVEACLAVARKHLAPGGLLLLDGYAADDFHEESLPEDVEADQLESVAQVEVADQRYSVFEQSAWDRDAQLLDVKYLYVREPSGEQLSFNLPQRYLLRAELVGMLERAGFDPIVVSGGFQGEPYDAEAEHLVIAAEAPS